MLLSISDPPKSRAPVTINLMPDQKPTLGYGKRVIKWWVPWMHVFIALTAAAMTAFIMFKIAQWSGLSKSFHDGIGVGCLSFHPFSKEVERSGIKKLVGLFA